MPDSFVLKPEDQKAVEWFRRMHGFGLYRLLSRMSFMITAYSNAVDVFNTSSLTVSYSDPNALSDFDVLLYLKLPSVVFGVTGAMLGLYIFGLFLSYMLLGSLLSEPKTTTLLLLFVFLAVALWLLALYLSRVEVRYHRRKIFLAYGIKDA